MAIVSGAGEGSLDKLKRPKRFASPEEFCEFTDESGKSHDPRLRHIPFLSISPLSNSLL